MRKIISTKSNIQTITPKPTNSRFDTPRLSENIQCGNAAAVSAASADRSNQYGNQDCCFLISDTFGGVLDGVGGRPYGREASQLIKSQLIIKANEGALPDTPAMMVSVLRRINRKLMFSPYATGATTLTFGIRQAASDNRDTLLVCSYGDSRAYIYDGQTLQPASVDNVDPLGMVSTLKAAIDSRKIGFFDNNGEFVSIDRATYTYQALFDDLVAKRLLVSDQKGSMTLATFANAPDPVLFSALFCDNKPLADHTIENGSALKYVYALIDEKTFPRLDLTATQAFLSHTDGNAGTQEDLKKFNHRNIISNIFCQEYMAIPCFYQRGISKSSSVILVSDGVGDNLTDTQILHCLQTSDTKQEQATSLMETAYQTSRQDRNVNRRVKIDDVTVCVL